MNLLDKYQQDIFERYTDLKNSSKKKEDLNGIDLWKIFELYVCIMLSDEHKRLFYNYEDIDPNFKEENKMTQIDTGIDCCDKDNTIVQCKLRKYSLTLRDCATFFTSQIGENKETKEACIRWKNMIIARNDGLKMSKSLIKKGFIFTDKSYSIDVMLDYCEGLLIKPPIIPVIKDVDKLVMRDYQIDCVNLIKTKAKNTVISIPTGGGKNVIIINSMLDDRKYLVLVPKIILMEQFYDDLITHKPYLKNKTQMIGDNNKKYNADKNITICVYNSVKLVEKYWTQCDKVYIDEAHHVYTPQIYNNDEDLDDDNDEESIESEDEELLSTYLESIRNKTKHNNNVYLSATIDKIDGFEYYGKDIRWMIDNEYLCEYVATVPVFSNDPTNRNICEYLIKYYRSIIIYCDSHKEGNEINKLLNEIMPNSSQYIDCRTSRVARRKIISDYKNGSTPFLVNVRVLTEGFDAPITKGVCFIHIPTTKNTLIQIMGRALRPHPTKTYANMILPFSTSGDDHSIRHFLKIMSQNDSRFKKSYDAKSNGGYINIVRPEEEIYINHKEKMDEIYHRYDLIYGSLGTLINEDEVWEKNFTFSQEYMDKYKERPQFTMKDTHLKYIAGWIDRQQKLYKAKKGRMVDPKYYDRWTAFLEKYNKYLDKYMVWKAMLELVKIYIDKKEIRPLEKSAVEEIAELGKWLSNQLRIYKEKSGIMLTPEIYDLFMEFIGNPKYKKLFLSDEEKWINYLNDVKHHIDTIGKRPSSEDNNENIKALGDWLVKQTSNYKAITGSQILTVNKYIRKLWEAFINDPKYKKHFLSDEEEWEMKFNELEQFIIDNDGKRPNCKSTDPIQKKMAEWIQTQRKAYIKQKYAMANEKTRERWDAFVAKYLKKKIMQKIDVKIH